MLNNNLSDLLQYKMIRFCIGLYSPISRVLVEFVVNEAFDKKRNHDMRGIKETQKFKPGDAQGTPG